MKYLKIFSISLLLATFAGCGKNDGNIIIIAERMNTNSKVMINPAQIQAASQWVAGEPVKLNNSIFYVQGDNGSYYLENSDDQAIIDGSKLAFYPGQSVNGKLDISLDGNTMLINRLSVIFDGNGNHEMAFPMVAIASAGQKQLPFKHLTGGFRVTLQNTSNNPVNVASLKIVAQSTSEVESLGFPEDVKTYTAKWAVQGPSVPTGNVGQNGNSVDVKYCSEMNFDLKSGGNNYATINGNNGILQFCIPITISSVKKLIVTGYATDGTELFQVHKTYTNLETVERNRMYDIPTIAF